MTTKTQKKKESNDSDVRGPDTSLVYYAKDFEKTFFTGMSGVFPDDFQLVASVESAGLDEIWCLFNDFGHDAPCTSGLRSMCIGDVVTKPDGRNWILSNDEGWTLIDNGESLIIDSRKVRH